MVNQVAGQDTSSSSSDENDDKFFIDTVQADQNSPSNASQGVTTSASSQGANNSNQFSLGLMTPNQIGWLPLT